MEILFKDDKKVYYIERNLLSHIYNACLKNDLSTIKHLDDAEVLYHYINTRSGLRYPVYYELNNRFITKYNNGIYAWCWIYSYHIKDNTIPNLNLLQNGNII